MSHTEAEVVYTHSDERCDAIDYRHVVTIQEHGALLVLDADDFTVRQASDNALEVLGTPARDLIGTNPFVTGALRDPDAAVAAVLGSATGEPVLTPSLVTADERELVGRLHRVGDRLVFELEPEASAMDHPLIRPESMLTEAIEAAADARSITEFLDLITQIVRVHLRFDTVTVNRLDEEWNGEVVAECRNERMPPMLGMRWPATDFPAGARAIMLDTPIRHTSDNHCDLATLVGESGGAVVDLARARIRGIGGPCREYYRNAGLRSTVVLSIVVNGRLWGVLSARHASAARVHPRYDETLIGLAKIMSVAVNRFDAEARMEADLIAADIYAAIASVPIDDPLWLERLSPRLETLRDVIGADGLVVLAGDERYGSGCDALPTKTIRTVLDRTDPSGDGSLRLDHRAAANHPDLDLHGVAGVLGVTLPTGNGDAVVWLRREQDQEVAWLGRPQIMEVKVGEERRVGPRSSFDRWLEVVGGSCTAWTSDEVRLAMSTGVQLGAHLMSWRAQRASRTKSEFLTNMSHELRTPLTAILGFAEVIEEGGSDRAMVDAATTIRRQGSHLLTLINDILDLSKIEAGKLEVVRESAELVPMLHDVSELLGGKASDKGIALETIWDGRVPPVVTTDAVRVKQVLVNLVGNAIKFTDTGGVRIRVSWQADAGDRGRLRVQVEDTGAGMNPEQLVRVFTPFEQADATTSRTHGGTGLGLAIATKLAGQLGGVLDATSEPGVGSTFRFEFDAGDLDSAAFVDPAAGTAAATAGESADPSGQSTAILSGRRVLVAEDGPDNQRLISFLLRKAGMVVDLAENGRAAVEHVEAAAASGQAPDVILMDMQMPEMDGYQATAALRERGHRTPIIALTAHAMAGDRERCIDAGCDDYSTKPVKKAALLSILARWVAESTGEAEARRAA